MSKLLRKFWLGRDAFQDVVDRLPVHPDNFRAGLPPDEARRQAVLKFGTVEAIKEDYRDQRSLLFVETLLRDTRYALRQLRRSPAFTARLCGFS
jgi:hypothetical protein